MLQTPRETHRLKKGSNRKGTILRVMDNGEILQKVDGGPWELWTQLDKKGIERIESIVKILEGDGFERTK